jgi:hypothetical protein
MTIIDTQDQEPADVEPSATSPKIRTRRSFAKLRRELTDDELSSSAVQRLLLDELDRLEREVDNLTSYREQYYTAEKERAVLVQKVNQSTANEILFAVTLTVGSAALGYAPSVWDSQPSGYMALIFGVVLIVGGIIARVRQGQITDER